MRKSFEEMVGRLAARSALELDRIRPLAGGGRQPAARAVAATAAALLLSGCTAWRSAQAPLYVQFDASRCAAAADTLLVLLPGVYSNPQEFVREGFVQAVQDARLAVDVARVDAHLNYYERGTVVERLHQDVIGPARERGYRSIWIVGISLGGFGGLVYAQEHPAQLAGVVALAPYLGDPAISDAVARAGGLRHWQAPELGSEADDRQRRETSLWRSLQRYSNSPVGVTPLYLGYGRADRFAQSNELLAEVLPKERVFTTEGGHDWAPWRRLWHQLLPTLTLPSCAA